MTSRREIQAQLDRLDRQIARQLAPILDHPAFRRLRGAWQGLRYLVRALENRGMLRIAVLDITRAELREELGEFSGEGWRRSRPYKLFHDMVYGGFGGEPYGLLILDGEVADGPEDTCLLDGLDRLAREAHATMVVAVGEGAGPAERDHVHLTRPARRSGMSTAYLAAWRVAAAFGREGWFVDVETWKERESGTRLPLLLAAQTFARSMKCLVRDRIGGVYEREDLDNMLNGWLEGYVAEGEPSVERPLVGAGVTVEYDLDHDRDLRFRFRLESAWKLAPRPGGIEVTGRLVR